jgi:hypothetical protein
MFELSETRYSIPEDIDHGEFEVSKDVRLDFTFYYYVYFNDNSRIEVLNQDLSGSNQDQNTNSLTTDKEAQVEFLNTALKEMAADASPDRLMAVQENLLQSVLPVLQATSEFAPLLSSGKGIWNTLKDMPLERLYDLFQASEGGEDNDAAFYAENLKQLREIFQNPDQAIRFLEDFKVPCTATNIMLAGQVLNNSNSFFKKYYQLRDENTEEKSQTGLKNLGELTDTLIDKESMDQTYEQLSSETTELLQVDVRGSESSGIYTCRFRNQHWQVPPYLCSCIIGMISLGL